MNNLAPSTGTRNDAMDYTYRPARTLQLRHYLLFVIALSMLPGCNDESADGPGADPILGNDCATVSAGPPDLAMVDTSATPRTDAGAEILALEVSAAFIAPEAVYQRVAGELAGIRAGFPELAHIEVRGCHDPGSVIVHFTLDGFEQVQSGKYTAWDAFNDNLRLRDVQTFPSLLPPSPVVLHFEGRYNANRLAAGYSALPEVVSADPNGFAGDGPDVCLARREDVHFYIFRDAGGDCPAGCTEQSFTALTVDDSGNIAEIGEWNGTGTPPGWFDEAMDCRVFLQPPGFPPSAVQDAPALAAGR